MGASVISYARWYYSWSKEFLEAGKKRLAGFWTMTNCELAAEPNKNLLMPRMGNARREKRACRLAEDDAIIAVRQKSPRRAGSGHAGQEDPTPGLSLASACALAAVTLIPFVSVLYISNIEGVSVP